MQDFTLYNATVFTGNDVLHGASVRVANGLIQEVCAGGPNDADGIDLRGQWLVPGFVDLQLYGGSDVCLNESPTAETVAHIYQTHLKNGTTSVLPTLYSTSFDITLKAVEAVRIGQKTAPDGVLGLHVEGPYINPEKRGVHSVTHVRPPVDAELDELLEKGREVIRILTVAPEIFHPEQLSRLLEQTRTTPIRLSVGHSNATYQQATAAFNAEIPLATHLYNAMRPFESREPGTVGAIFDHPTVRASIVADGFHCDWASIRVAKRLLNERLFLISDAMFANPPRPSHALEDLVIQYENGRYTNHEGKLAGSAITLLDAVRNGIQYVGLEPDEAFRMASTVPAEIMGLDNTLGKIQAGFVANLVVLTDALAVSEVIANGQFQNRSR
ncbi:N-acetylglucosamine-6-phosphate deacetylase [Larkinella arboricola]